MYYLIKVSELREATKEDYPNLGLPLVSEISRSSNIDGLEYVQETKQEKPEFDEATQALRKLENLVTNDEELKIITNRYEVVDVPQVIPDRVATYKLTIVMESLGYDVEAEINKIEPQEARDQAFTVWKMAPYADRGHDVIQTLQASFGIDDEEGDQIFLAASQLYPEYE